VKAVTWVTLTTPLTEELVFRGVVFRILEGVFGSWVALVLSSLWFGYVHSGNSGETFVGVAAIAAYIDDQRPLPLPSLPQQEETLSPLPLDIAWKAERYNKLRLQRPMINPLVSLP
jgi:hypothetical protein